MSLTVHNRRSDIVLRHSDRLNDGYRRFNRNNRLITPMPNVVCTNGLDAARRTTPTRTGNRQSISGFQHRQCLRNTVRGWFLNGCERLMCKHQHRFVMRGDVIIRPCKTRGGLFIARMGDLSPLTHGQTRIIPITTQATTATTTTATSAAFTVCTFTVTGKFTRLARRDTFDLLIGFAIEGDAINIGLRRIKGHRPRHIRPI
jgi:hypothetical protein